LYRFFFQAEDGIRAFHVTGVQTCALPILAARVPGTQPPDPPHRLAGGGGVGMPAPLVLRGEEARPPRRASPASREKRSRATRARSEERRVGKEGRSRWARYG